MAIVNPELVLIDAGQDCTVTVSVTSATDISAWLVTAILRAANGSTALATKTLGSGITSSYAGTTQTWVITFSATDTNQEPGAYVWDMRRQDSGAVYQIIEPSGFIIRNNAVANYPELTNLSEWMAHSFNSTQPTEALAKQLTQILYAAESRVRRYCNRLFTKNTYTEYPVLNWAQPIFLTETPVQSITSLYLDWGASAGQSANPFPADTLLDPTTDYFLDRDRNLDNYSDTGFIYRSGGTGIGFWGGGGPGGWAAGYARYPGKLSYSRVPVKGAVKCTYVGGYTTIPYDLKMIVWNTATIMRQFAPSGRLMNNWSGEGLSIGYMQMENLIKNYWSNQSIIDSYRRGDSRIG